MRSSLRQISLLALFCCWFAHTNGATLQEVSDSTTYQEYNLTMNARGNEITGIFMMNVSPDKTIVGTVVNEFGVKAFDFTVKNGKTKLLNVMGPLNKWYIKKVLRKDLSFIIENLNRGENVEKGKRTLTILPNGDIQVNNAKFKISYTFSEINL